MSNTGVEKDFLSPRLMKAMNTAAVAHRDHTRKGSGIPYVAHLFGVMHLLAQVTDDEDVLIAGLLHDVIEDVPENYSAQQMKADFGERVVEIVLGVTKDDSLKSWEDRSNAYIAHLRDVASDEAVMVSCADKLHNLKSIMDDHAILGEELWSRFNSGKDRQQWWYRQIHEVVAVRLPGFPLNSELGQLVAEMEQY